MKSCTLVRNSIMPLHRVKKAGEAQSNLWKIVERSSFCWKTVL